MNKILQPHLSEPLTEAVSRIASREMRGWMDQVSTIDLTTERVYIREETDFPDPVNGEILLEDKEYIIVGTVNVALPLVPPKDLICSFIGMNTLNGYLNYTGSDALFKNHDYGAGIIFLTVITVGCSGSGQVFDIIGNRASAVIGHQVAYVGVNSLGYCEGSLFVILISNVFDYGQGITLHDNEGVVLSEISWDLGRNELMTFISISGQQANIEITNDFLNTAGPNETIFNFDSELTTTGGVVGLISLDVSDGGTKFAPGSLDQTSLEWKYTGNTGVPDSTVKGILQTSGSILITTMVSAGVPTQINAEWNDGQIEERICFADKCTFDGATDIVTTADGTVDSIGGTPFTHNLSNGDSILLTENGGLPSLLVSGQNYFVGNVTATTFQLFPDNTLTTPVDFTGNGVEPNYYCHTTGTSRSGLFIYLGLEDASLQLAGWVTVQKTAGADSPVKAVIMTTDTSFVISNNSDGSTVSAKNNVPSSSAIQDIINLSTGEGFMIYIENGGGSVVNNEITDARVICSLS